MNQQGMNNLWALVWSSENIDTWEAMLGLAKPNWTEQGMRGANCIIDGITKDDDDQERWLKIWREQVKSKVSIDNFLGRSSYSLVNLKGELLEEVSDAKLLEVLEKGSDYNVRSVMEKDNHVVMRRAIALGFKPENLVDDVVFRVRSTEMFEIFVENGYQFKEKLEGLSFLEYLKKINKHEFASEKVRKGLWSAVEKFNLSQANPEAQEQVKLEALVSSIKEAKTGAELKFAYKAFFGEEKKDWKGIHFKDGANLLMLTAATNFYMLPPAVKFLKASPEDLKMQDKNGLTLFDYALACGRTSLDYANSDAIKEQFIKASEILAAAKRPVDLLINEEFMKSRQLSLSLFDEVGLLPFRGLGFKKDINDYLLKVWLKDSKNSRINPNGKVSNNVQDILEKQQTDFSWLKEGFPYSLAQSSKDIDYLCGPLQLTLTNKVSSGLYHIPSAEDIPGFMGPWRVMMRHEQKIREVVKDFEPLFNEYLVYRHFRQIDLYLDKFYQDADRNAYMQSDVFRKQLTYLSTLMDSVPKGKQTVMVETLQICGSDKIQGVLSPIVEKFKLEKMFLQDQPKIKRRVVL
jgi:hypothetical protein